MSQCNDIQELKEKVSNPGLHFMHNAWAMPLLAWSARHVLTW